VAVPGGRLLRAAGRDVAGVVAVKALVLFVVREVTRTTL
jgi:hypothetical protein